MVVQAVRLRPAAAKIRCLFVAPQAMRNGRSPMLRPPHRRPSAGSRLWSELRCWLAPLAIPDSPTRNLQVPPSALDGGVRAARPAGPAIGFLGALFDIWGLTDELGHKQRGGSVVEIASRAPLLQAAGIEHWRCDRRMPHGFLLSWGDVDSPAPNPPPQRIARSWGSSSSSQAGVEVAHRFHPSRNTLRRPQQGPSQGHPWALARRKRSAAALWRSSPSCSSSEHVNRRSRAMVARHRRPRISIPSERLRPRLKVGKSA